MKELRLAFIGFGSANQALARMLLEKSEPLGDQKRYLRIGKRLVVRYGGFFLCSYILIQNLTLISTLVIAVESCVYYYPTAWSHMFIAGW